MVISAAHIPNDPVHCKQARPPGAVAPGGCFGVRWMAVIALCLKDSGYKIFRFTKRRILELEAILKGRDSK